MCAQAANPAAAGVSEAAQAAGSFDWERRWYPVLWAEDFDASRPFAFTLWDRPLVLVRDVGSGEFAAMDDRCPHRAAPLSEGRVYVREGRTVLECGYHGWTYGCDGRCVRIPQGEGAVPRRADVERVYRCRVRCGIVFVWFGGVGEEEEGGEEEGVGGMGLPEWLERGDARGDVLFFRNQTRVLPYDLLTFQESAFCGGR